MSEGFEREGGRRDRDPYAPPPGFMSKALDSMPQSVLGAIGIFMGVSISMVIVLKMGGLDGVVVRVANAYAAGLETQMTTLAAETTKLAAVNKNLETVVTRLEALDSRVVAAERRIDAVEERSTITAVKVDAVAGRVDEVKGKLDRLGKWACDHVDAVKTRPTAPDCGGQ